MGENSKIEWTHHTFNPWWGCTKISPGCANCYAESFAKRTGWANGSPSGKPELWGNRGERRFFGDSHWSEPLKWNREAEKTGVRARVFCASMADWLEDREDLTRPLARLLERIHATPHLDWLLLTKRPENWRGRLVQASQCFGPGNIVEDWLQGEAPHNVWIGTTVEDQQRAEERIPALMRIPARVRFLSCEPLLSRLDLGPVWHACGAPEWVICGGESGPNARPMHPMWARDLLRFCEGWKVPFFFKQWGEWIPVKPLIQGEVVGQRERGCIVIGPAGGVYHPHHRASGQAYEVKRVGKAAAGRDIDGRKWSEFPTTS